MPSEQWSKEAHAQAKTPLSNPACMPVPLADALGAGGERNQASASALRATSEAAAAIANGAVHAPTTAPVKCPTVTAASLAARASNVVASS